MKQVTLRECTDRRWSATYEDVDGLVTNPLAFAVGDTQLDAANALMAKCPEAVDVQDIRIVRLKF